MAKCPHRAEENAAAVFAAYAAALEHQVEPEDEGPAEPSSIDSLRNLVGALLEEDESDPEDGFPVSLS